jgi:hypothetical protein
MAGTATANGLPSQECYSVAKIGRSMMEVRQAGASLTDVLLEMPDTSHGQIARALAVIAYGMPPMITAAGRLKAINQFESQVLASCMRLEGN